MVKKRVVLLFLLLSIAAKGQNISWDIHYDMSVDNHEHAKMDVGVSKTLYGLYLAPVVGLSWDSGKQSLNMGFDIDAKFGEVANPYQSSYLIYYKLDTPNHLVCAGRFPIKDLLDDFPEALIDDAHHFYDNSLDGILYRYSNERGYITTIYDMPWWVNNYLSEIMTLYSISKWSFGPLFLGYSFYLHHYAYAIDQGLIIDNIWLYPTLGIDLGKYISLDKAQITLNGVITAQRNRQITKDLFFPKGGEIGVSLEKWNVGINNTIYFGDNLHPYRGHDMLYIGEEMYGTTTGWYDRLECYYIPYQTELVEVSVSLMMHANGSGLGWQQKAGIVINLDNNNYKLKKKKR